MEPQKININIKDGEAFFAHEVSINFNPLQFILDFKCITPRVDPRGERPSIAIEHNVIMVDPYHAKRILELLSKVIERYEKEFGKIEKPKALKRIEKEQQKLAKRKKDIKLPTYLG